jgi:hypothetical protein
VFGKTNNSAINLSTIADASNPTGGFVINGETAGDWNGNSVSSAGDVNGDGLDDLIVGSFLADPSGKLSAGKSYVVFGKANSSAINLSAMPFQSPAVSPLITKPPVGLLASAIALRLMALLLVLPNTT